MFTLKNNINEIIIILYYLIMLSISLVFDATHATLNIKLNVNDNPF